MKCHFIEQFAQPGEKVSLYKTRQVRGLLPRPAHPVHRQHQGLQAAQHRRRLLAGQRKVIRNCSASTAPRSTPGKRWTSTLSRRRRPSAATIALLGKQLDLFSIQELAGPGLIFWHPKGGLIRTIMEDWLRAGVPEARLFARLHPARGAPPALADQRPRGLLRREHVRPSWNSTMPSIVMKPMNCPFHILIYKDQLRSYRDLPVRLGELGTVYRYERSGVMHGLMRVRGFTQDDAHIFCTPEQIEDEIAGCIDFRRGACCTPSALRNSRWSFPAGTPRTARTTWAAPSSGTSPQDVAAEGARMAAEHSLQVHPRRGRLLRAEDRREAGGRHRAAVAAFHGAVRLQPAAALRAGVRGRGRRSVISR